MPVSIQIMNFGQRALTSFQQGDVAGGLAALEEQAFAFASELSTATPFEVAMLLAGAGKVLEAVGLFELAALKYADAAAYAEIREPGTTETAGNFADLATMLEKIGNRVGALRALQHSAEHLKLAGAWQNYQANYEAHIARLEVEGEGSS